MYVPLNEWLWLVVKLRKDAIAAADLGLQVMHRASEAIGGSHLANAPG